MLYCYYRWQVMRTRLSAENISGVEFLSYVFVGFIYRRGWLMKILKVNIGKYIYILFCFRFILYSLNIYSVKQSENRKIHMNFTCLLKAKASISHSNDNLKNRIKFSTYTFCFVYIKWYIHIKRIKREEETTWVWCDVF